MNFPEMSAERAGPDELQTQSMTCVVILGSGEGPGSCKGKRAGDGAGRQGFHGLGFYTLAQSKVLLV